MDRSDIVTVTRRKTAVEIAEELDALADAHEKGSAIPTAADAGIVRKVATEIHGAQVNALRIAANHVRKVFI